MSISIGSVLQQSQPKPAAGGASALGQAEAPAARPTGKTVTVSEGAARQALLLMGKAGHDPADTFLRLGVKGGGCSGLAYLIDFSKKKDLGDVEMEYFGVKVLIDRKSLIYLGGTQLEWATGLQAGWRFNNPNSKKGCSCGESFSI